jgi:hypothetical protein
MDSSQLLAERARLLHGRMEAIAHEIRSIDEQCASEYGNKDFWASLERWAMTALVRTHRLGQRAQALAIDAVRDGATSEVRDCKGLVDAAVEMTDDIRAVLVKIKARTVPGTTLQRASAA